MPYAKNKEVSLYYEDHGSPTAPALIMIQGYTAQLIGWEHAFVEILNAKGVRTILFDNRDVGLSTQLGEPEDIGKKYSIADMADDVMAVADACGLSKFHILGGSMGGQIAQQVLVDHMERIKSATIMFTAPANEGRWMSAPSPSGHTFDEVPEAVGSRKEYVETFVARERACHEDSAYGFDDQWARELAGLTYDRCYRIDGWERQKACTAGLKIDIDGLDAYEGPAAIIHGGKDPFFNIDSAICISKHLKNSELHIYPNMTHELPRQLWAEFAEIIQRTVLRGEGFVA